MSLNRVLLTGRLTAKPEYRSSPSGVSVSRFSLAVNEFVKSEKKTSFFDCVSFGKQAEVIRDYLDKGALVAIDGSLRQERWETKEGEKKNKISVIVQRIEFLSSKEKGPEKSSIYEEEYPSSGSEDSSYSIMDEHIDDIPF